MDHLVDPARGLYHRNVARHHKLLGGIMFGVVGGAVGAAAGGLIGGGEEISIGLLIGAGLGIVTGVTVGDAARIGAEVTYRTSPAALLGYVVVDREGRRIGKIVSVYVDQQSAPRYLGVSTLWMSGALAHLVPIACAHFAQEHRRVRIGASAEVIRTAPTCRLDGTVDEVLVESLRQHYEPHGIFIAPPHPESQILEDPRADVVPEFEDVELMDVPIEGVTYSGDAPYRSSANVGKARTPSGRRSASVPPSRSNATPKR